MSRKKYVELIQNSTVLVRELNSKRFNHKLHQLGLKGLLDNSGVKIVEKITTITRPVGSIFEGTL